MTERACLDEGRLIEFVDECLPRETMQQVELHLRTCSRCLRTVNALNQLCGDIRTPHAGELDVPAHVEAVLARLDRPVRAPKVPREKAWFAALSAFSVAAALLVYVSTRPKPTDDFYQARGGPSQGSLAREVGVHPFAYEGTARRLRDGSRIRADTPLGASFRNLGTTPAYLLLFALDASKSVHWISPPYVLAGSDPAATPLPPSQSERTLEITSVLEDVRPGPLQLISLLTREQTHVSDIERLAPSDLDPQSLKQRFADASLQVTTLEIDVEGAGTR